MQAVSIFPFAAQRQGLRSFTSLKISANLRSRRRINIWKTREHFRSEIFINLYIFFDSDEINEAGFHSELGWTQREKCRAREKRHLGRHRSIERPRSRIHLVFRVDFLS